MADYKVAIDAGHGGSDPGAVYQGRREKDDVLNLAYAVGDILSRNGVDVFYVREADEYETPFKKATDGNNSGADLFLSIHRNSSENPNQYTGVETLVYNDSGMKADLARDINHRLENVGFKNLGVDERPNLVVLKRTRMPAVMVEAGFINNDKDNALFDQQFNEIAQAIADAILSTAVPANTAPVASAPMAGAPTASVPMANAPTASAPTANMPRTAPPSARQTLSAPNVSANANTISHTGEMTPMMPMEENGDAPEKLYRVQVGAFRNKESADRLLNSLYIEGFPAFIIMDDGLYKVQVGAFRFLANAIKMEERLRKFRYNTFITT